jgi:hypothetical protein
MPRVVAFVCLLGFCSCATAPIIKKETEQKRRLVYEPPDHLTLHVVQTDCEGVLIERRGWPVVDESTRKCKDSVYTLEKPFEYVLKVRSSKTIPWFRGRSDSKGIIAIREALTKALEGAVVAPEIELAEPDAEWDLLFGLEPLTEFSQEKIELNFPADILPDSLWAVWYRLMDESPGNSRAAWEVCKREASEPRARVECVAKAASAERREQRERELAEQRARFSTSNHVEDFKQQNARMLEAANARAADARATYDATPAPVVEKPPQQAGTTQPRPEQARAEPKTAPLPAIALEPKTSSKSVVPRGRIKHRIVWDDPIRYVHPGGRTYTSRRKIEAIAGGREETIQYLTELFSAKCGDPNWVTFSWEEPITCVRHSADGDESVPTSILYRCEAVERCDWRRGKAQTGVIRQ